MNHNSRIQSKRWTFLSANITLQIGRSTECGWWASHIAETNQKQTVCVFGSTIMACCSRPSTAAEAALISSSTLRHLEFNRTWRTNQTHTHTHTLQHAHIIRVRIIVCSCTRKRTERRDGIRISRSKHNHNVVNRTVIYISLCTTLCNIHERMKRRAYVCVCWSSDNQVEKRANSYIPSRIFCCLPRRRIRMRTSVRISVMVIRNELSALNYRVQSTRTLRQFDQLENRPIDCCQLCSNRLIAR